MKFKLSKQEKSINGTIQLVASKSESNRALIIKALCKDDFAIQNLSKAEDTITLQKLLQSNSHELDVGAAGTTMRFLTAYLACQEGEWILKGSDRMHKRPINILVDALKQLGANIEYLENDGFPPLMIQGKNLAGSAIDIRGDVSSQFISALLMIAPTLKGGLNLTLKGKILSKPYIELTLKLMNYFGIEYQMIDHEISISNQKYVAQDYTVENDWSAASYWYQLACFADTAEIIIPNLFKESLQGDSVISEIMKSFGIETTFLNDGIKIIKKGNPVYSDNNPFVFDFSDNPDLAQTLIVTCAGLKISFKINGLDNLSIKETDRIKALQTELGKINIILNRSDNYFSTTYNDIVNAKPVIFNTYEDHRMAMCLAPLALRYANVSITDPEVVSKSYPNYWEELRSVGFNIEEV
ncbi:MAG: 3-phosphoshikimate 1-carboxyvinyltransferase [Bacteroidetes bacterium]|nr:MAG: 3-phosphoshikimate 1-carboxyvinyltransferase [Bacteroidota bacterium]